MTYRGDWEWGKRHGFGEMFYKNGKCMYKGEWARGMKHDDSGEAVFYDEEGELVSKGEWAKDRPKAKITEGDGL